MLNQDLNQMLRLLNQKPIAYQRIYAQITKSLTAGLLLSQVVYWWYACKETEFYKTDRSFAEELFMGNSEFRNAKKILQDLNLITTCLKQIPAKTHYILNVETLVCMITSFDIGRKQDYRLEPNKISSNLESNKETNKEIKKENKKNSPDIDTTEFLLAEYMLELILLRKPNFHRSKLATKKQKQERIISWCKPIKTMLYKDKISPEHIIKVMDYVASKPFYATNILSTDKLSKRFDEIEMDMQKNGVLEPEPIFDPNKKLTDKLIRTYGILINNRDYCPLNEHELRKFIESSEKMIEFYSKHSIIKENWLKYLAKCLTKVYKEQGQTLHPGHFNSRKTWEVLLPQFLEELGIGR